MNLTEKLSNPFLKPSPFRSATNSNNTSYYNYGNLNQSKVSPLMPQYNRHQQSPIKPTKDYDAAEFNRYAYKEHSRGQGSNYKDRIGYPHYDSYTQKQYELNRPIDYGKSQYDINNYNNNKFANSRINYNDNKSDTGSANTYINKIYQIEDKQLKFRSSETVNKPLINPFERKYLIRPTDIEDIPIMPVLSNYNYYPMSKNYTQSNNYNVGGLQNQYSDNNRNKANYPKQTQLNEYNILSNKFLNNEDYDQRPINQYEDYASKYQNQLNLQKKYSFDPNQRQTSNQKQRNSRKDKPNISNRKFEDQQPQNNDEPVFGHTQDQRFTLDNDPYHSKNTIRFSHKGSDRQPSEAFNSNKNLQQILENVPRIIKFDEQSDEQRVKPQHVQNMNITNKPKKDKQYPQFIQLRGMTFHRINTF